MTEAFQDAADVATHKPAMRRLRASRTAAKTTIVGILLVVVLGIAMASVTFSVFSSTQRISELSRRDVRIWQDIGRTVTYVLGAREERPVPPEVAEKMQLRVSDLLDKEVQISGEVAALAKSSRFFRKLLFTTDAEEEAIERADVDPELRQQVRQFTKALPSIVAAGFSAWSGVNDLKLRSGFVLKPLLAREDVLFDLKSRIINAMWRIFLVICAIFVAAVSFFWFRLLAPSFNRRQQAVIDDAKGARALARAKRQLQDSEHFLRVLLDNTPGMIASLDRNLHYTSANRTYIEAVGAAHQDQIVGRSVEQVLGRAMWAKLREPLNKAARGQSMRIEAFADCFDPPRYVEAVYVPQLDGHGVPCGVIALIMDVHEQRVAREALRISETDLRATLNSIRDAVVTLDEAGAVTRMNPAAEQLVGVSTDNARQKPLRDIVDVREKSTRQPVAYVDIQRASERPQFDGEALLIGRDGNEFDVWLTISPICDLAEEKRGAVVVMRDMTDQNILRQQMSQHDRLTALGQLAGGIAHDFNNVLASMRGAAEILEVDEGRGSRARASPS